MFLRFFLAAFCIFFTGCSQNDLSKNSSVKIAIPNDPSTLDPRKARDMISSDISALLFSGLTGIDPNGNVFYDIASDITTSEDMLEKTIFLKNAHWSDGSRITAEDVVYSWLSALDKKRASPNANVLFWIENASKIYDEKCSTMDFGATVINDTTIHVKLINPCPFFEKLLATSVYRPIQKRYDQENKAWNNVKNLPCSGPYIIKSWDLTKSIELEANPSHLLAKTTTPLSFITIDDQAAIALFEAGQIDLAGSPLGTVPAAMLTQIQKSPFFHTSPAFGTAFLRVNTTKTALQNPLLRRSLYYAIDRKGIIQHIFENSQTEACSLIPFLHKTIPDDRETNLLFSQKLFQAYCKEQSCSPESIQLHLMIGTSESARKVGEVIQNTLKKHLGVTVHLQPTETKTLYSRLRAKEYDLALGSYFGDYDDPHALFSVFADKNNGTNNTGWESTEFSQTLHNSLRAKTAEERLFLYKQLDALLFEEMPIIPLYHVNFSYMKGKRCDAFSIHSSGQMVFSS